jgi:hypothetical protein
MASNQAVVPTKPKGPAMTSALRDALRSKVFSATRTSKLVPIGTPVEGEEPLFVEVRSAVVGEMLDSMDSGNMRQRIARMMINNTFVPGTSEKVFEEADFEGLMELPADGTYQALMTAITDSITPAKVEAAAKKT